MKRYIPIIIIALAVMALIIGWRYLTPNNGNFTPTKTIYEASPVPDYVPTPDNPEGKG